MKELYSDPQIEFITQVADVITTSNDPALSDIEWRLGFDPAGKDREWEIPIE